MGYLEDEVKHLRSVIDALDGRVKALESRQLIGGPKPATTEEIRMILIGPPGAGMFTFPKNTSRLRTTEPFSSFGTNFLGRQIAN